MKAIWTIFADVTISLRHVVFAVSSHFRLLHGFGKSPHHNHFSLSKLKVCDG